MNPTILHVLYSSNTYVYFLCIGSINLLTGSQVTLAKFYPSFSLLGIQVNNKELYD